MVPSLKTPVVQRPVMQDFGSGDTGPDLVGGIVFPGRSISFIGGCPYLVV